MHRKTMDALEELERLIRFGEVGVSGFLPAERDLCRRLKIGRGALAAVLTELAKRELVCRIPGKGIKILFRNEEENWRKFLVVIFGNTLNVTEQFEILRGIAAAAEDRDAEIVLFFHRKDFIDRRLSERLADVSLDGVIFIEKYPDRICEAMSQSPLPCIVVNYEGENSVPAIRVNYRQTGRLAGRCLVEAGHRRIGYIGHKGSFIYKEMFAGLKGALAEDDLTIAPELTLTFDYACPADECRKRIEETLAKNSFPCAFFAGRDRWAQLIFEAAEKLGKRIPEDISVIGNDRVTWPDADRCGLTGFVQPAFASGRAALEALCDAKKSGKPIETIMLTGDFVPGTSVKKIERDCF